MARASAGGIARLLACVAVLLLAVGLLSPLIPLRASAAQLSPMDIGLIGAGYFAGFLLAPWAAPGLIARAGHVRVFAASATLAAAAVLVMSRTVSTPAWILARMAMGLAFATFYLIFESWLNDAADNRSRGRLLSAYIIVSKVGLIGGQLALNLTGLDGPAPFVTVAATIVAAGALMALSGGHAPHPPPRARLELRRLSRTSPVGVAGCFAYGLCEGAFYALATVFAQERGLSLAQITVFLATFLAGGALAQWPLGLLSDRLDRRWVVLGSVVAAAVSALALATTRQPLGLFCAAAALGGAFLPLYALCVAHANDLTTARDRVRTGGGLLLIYATGAVLGPIGASAALSAAGPAALPLSIFTVCSALAVFTAIQLARGRRRPPDPEAGSATLAPPPEAPGLHI